MASIKSLINMTRGALGKLSNKQLSNAYTRLNKLVSSRISTYKKHNMTHVLPKSITNLKGATDRSDMISDIGNMSNFL